MTDQQDITQERCAICGKPKGQPPECCDGHYASLYRFDEKNITQEEFTIDISMLHEDNKRLHAELLEIHTIAQCVAECPEVQDTDSLTVKAVKGMAQRIRLFEEYRAALENISTAVRNNSAYSCSELVDVMKGIAKQALEEK